MGWPTRGGQGLGPDVVGDQGLRCDGRRRGSHCYGSIVLRPGLPAEAPE